MYAEWQRAQDDRQTTDARTTELHDRLSALRARKLEQLAAAHEEAQTRLQEQRDAEVCDF